MGVFLKYTMILELGEMPVSNNKKKLKNLEKKINIITLP